MEKRFWIGLIIALTCYFAMYFGGIYLFALLLIISFCGCNEYTKILTNKGFFPSCKVIFLSSALFIFLAYMNSQSVAPLAITVCALIAFMWVLFRGKQPYIANVATILLGIFYCGWFPAHLIYIRNLGTTVTSGIQHPEGAGYCVMLIISVLLTDTFCYFVGCKYGKHKLSPVISPNKTIEGAIGGTAMCIIFSFVIGLFLNIAWYHALALGLLIAFFAQFGDLCESMIKRDAGVKDSSDILPGHGGFLDRTDSYILTLPVVYYYLQYFLHDTTWMNVFKGLF